MIVVLEGPDGSGKTTLAKSLNSAIWPSEALNLKCGPPSGDPFHEYMDLLDKASSTEKFVVIDRLHLGELVYGPLFRGESKLSWDQCLLIEERLDKIGAVKVALMPPLSEIIDRQIHRDGGKVDPKSGASVSDSGPIRDAYKTVLSKLFGWQLMISGSADAQALIIINKLARRAL